MRLGINLFFALMFTVMGVVYQPIIEKPIEIFYNGNVTHTATDYSYKPGQSGTEYEFYIEREDRGYDRLGMLESIGLPTLFYFGIFTFIGIIRRKFLRKKTRDYNSSIFQKRPDLVEKLKTMDEKNKNKSEFPPLLISLGIGIFFLAGHYQMFAGEKNGEETQMTNESFEPSHIVYVPNGEGTGDLWLIEEDKNGKDATFIQNERTTSFDSIIYTIKVLKQGETKRIDIDQIIVEDEFGSFDPFYSDNRVWLTARPNMLFAWNSSTRDKSLEDINAFSDPFEELESGIHKFYRHNAYKGVLYIETLDGAEYYYQISNDSLYISLSSIGKNNKPSELFGLYHANGDRYNITLKQGLGRPSTLENEFYLKPEILAQNSENCFIMHKKDVRDESPLRLSCIGKKAEIIWTIEEDDFPKKINNENDLIFSFRQNTGQIDGNILIVTFSDGLKVQGVFGVEISSGEIKWKYNYHEL